MQFSNATAAACPDLARQIKQFACGKPVDVQPWIQVLDMLTEFNHLTEREYEAKHVGNRIKQWLGYLRRNYSEACALFEDIKRLKWPQEIAAAIDRHKQCIKVAASRYDVA